MILCHVVSAHASHSLFLSFNIEPDAFTIHSVAAQHFLLEASLLKGKGWARRLLHAFHPVLDGVNLAWTDFFSIKFTPRHALIRAVLKLAPAEEGSVVKTALIDFPGVSEAIAAFGSQPAGALEIAVNQDLLPEIPSQFFAHLAFSTVTCHWQAKTRTLCLPRLLLRALLFRLLLTLSQLLNLSMRARPRLK